MQVAVTGGAGYIGSVVTDVLIREHHAVLVLDNLVKGHRDAVHDDALFANVDLVDRRAIAARLRDFGCEAVIHMAAHSLVGESVTDPAVYYGNNVVAGLSLLVAMRDAGVERLVFSSSAAVYGEPDRQPITEDAATRPTSPYGETKLVFEGVLRWYATAYGLRSVSLRYFNAAGATALRGERHEPETHLIRSCCARRSANCRSSPSLASITRRRMAPACAITFTSKIWRAPTCSPCRPLRTTQAAVRTTWVAAVPAILCAR
jgi:UDP-glucose 4-epimerase